MERYARGGFQELDLLRTVEKGLSLWICLLNTVVLSWLKQEAEFP